MNFLNSSFNLLSFKGGNDDKVRHEYDRGYIEISTNEKGLPTLQSRLFKITSDNDSSFTATYEYYSPFLYAGNHYTICKEKTGEFWLAPDCYSFNQMEKALALKDAKELKAEIEKCENKRIKNNPLNEKLDELIGYFEDEMGKTKEFFSGYDQSDFLVSPPENAEVNEDEMLEALPENFVVHNGRLYYRKDKKGALEERKIVRINNDDDKSYKSVYSKETGTLQTQELRKDGKLVVREEYGKNFRCLKCRFLDFLCRKHFLQKQNP